MATIANLSIAVTINAGNATQQLKTLTLQIQNFGNSFQKSMTSSVAFGNLWSKAISTIFSQASSNFSTFVGDAIKYSQQFNNALIGLSGVARAFGVDSKVAMGAARDLSKDGLLPLRDSAAGLKNLLMTGFSLEQSVKVMNAFKDSAAYARQETYSYGDAIRTASEGIKNMRSVQVDNVGITKNISVMMKEAGYQMQDISDKTKGYGARQALVNGILREAAATAGDANRSLGTYSGAIVAANTAWISFEAEVGTVITTNASVQAVLTVVADALRNCTDWLTKTGKGAYFVSDALVFMLRYIKVTLVVLDLLSQALSWVVIKLLEGAHYITEGLTKSYGAVLMLASGLAMLPGGQKALDAMGFSLAEAAKDYAKMAARNQELEESITTVREGQKTLSGIFDAGKKKVDEMIDVAIKYRGKLVDIGSAGREAGDGQDAMAAALDRAAKKAKEKLDTFQELYDLLNKTGDESGMKEAIGGILDMLPPAKKGMEALRDANFSFADIKKAADMVENIGGVAHVSELSTEKQKELHDVLEKSFQAMNNMGVRIPPKLRNIYDETNRIREEMDSVAESIKAVERAAVIAGAGFEWDIKEMPSWMAGGATDFNEAKMNAGEQKGQINDLLKQMQSPWRDAFKKLGAELPKVIADAMRSSGDNVWAAAAISAAGVFTDQFRKRFEEVKKTPGMKLTGSEKAMGIAGAGIEAFMGGYGIGASQGKVKGAIGGAASGALSGAAMGSMIMPGIGTAVGAVAGGFVGLLGGLFGGAKKAKEELAKVKEAQQDLLDQYGGMQNLQKIAQGLGVDISKAFNTKKPEEFKKVIDQLNAAIAEQKKRIEGLNTALKGLNDRATVFGDKFKKIYEATLPAEGAKPGAKPTQKQQDAKQAMQALAQSSEQEFARIGVMTQATFGGLVKETGNAIEAITQMGPAFQVLDDGVNKFGITSTAVIDNLLDSFHMVTDEALKPFFDAIVADGQVLKGLFDAKALNAESFQALAADIGAQIEGVVAHGGDMAKTLALSQPVLQTLWEASQQYGAVTDENTSKILKQAEEQGLVGAQFKSINEKILDVLLAIGDVLHADLPTYFDQLKKPADDAATDIENSFKKIDIPTIDVPYRYKREGGAIPTGGGEAPEGNVSVPALAGGGIVRRATLALVGEAGPEAVIPLNSRGLGLEPNNYETTIYLDGDKIARSSARRIPRIMRTLGVGH